jgi:transposase
MDNTRMHTGGEAACVETLLWDTVIDGRPLDIFIVYLPTCSPELNPIKFVFHILTARIRSLWPHHSRKSKKFFDEMDNALILNICIHCGY